MVFLYIDHRSCNTTIFPYTTLFRSPAPAGAAAAGAEPRACAPARPAEGCRTAAQRPPRSEEHTSELQSREKIVCRLLLEKKKLLKNIPLAEWKRDMTNMDFLNGLET